MLNIAEGRSIWLCTEVTDMRRSFDGLSAQVRRHLNKDPGRGDWYVFINRRRIQLKILAFEAGGYCLWSKRLEQDCFARPFSDACKLSLSRTALLALLDGIDIVIKRQRKRYKKTAPLT
jgi:transposase